jgi:hypothetical protein
LTRINIKSVADRCIAGYCVKQHHQTRE